VLRVASMPTTEQQQLIRKSSSALADFKRSLSTKVAGAAPTQTPSGNAAPAGAVKRFPVVAVQPASTKNVTITENMLDDADKAFVAGEWLTNEERQMMSSLHAFTASTSIGSTKATVPIRCISGSKASKVVLCLHGKDPDEQDRCLYMWAKFWPALLSNGFHVVALDFPGFGRANGSDGDLKTWKDNDAGLLLSIIESLQLPDNCVSVLAESMGAQVAVRSIAQDSAPFAPHHVLVNCSLGEKNLPASFGEKLEAIAGDISMYVCERFYAKQQIQGMVSAYMPFLSYLMGSYPECMAGYTFWKVRKDKDGKDADGPASVTSERPQEMWWVGYQAAIPGAARAKKAFLMLRR